MLSDCLGLHATGEIRGVFPIHIRKGPASQPDLALCQETGDRDQVGNAYTQVRQHGKFDFLVTSLSELVRQIFEDEPVSIGDFCSNFLC
jgi:hypothetical protein